MTSLRKLALILFCCFALSTEAKAQLTAPYSFSSGSVISSSQINANFALLQNALNRTGGTITGNITASAGVTIDGIDISATLNQTVLTTSSPTFAALTTTAGATIGTTLGVTGATTLTGALNANGAVDIAAGLTIGSGNVSLVDGTGKITAISATYFASLDGSNLTSLRNAGYTSTTQAVTYTALTTDGVILASGTITVNLYAVAGNAGRVLQIKNTGSGTVTVDANGAETIDGATTFALDVQYFSITLYCTGAEWVII